MNTTKNTVTAPAMTRDEWEELPAIARRFISWERAKRPVTVKRVQPPAKAYSDGYKYFTERPQ